MQVDLPQPDWPQRATVCPSFASKETFFKTCWSKRAGYVKSMFYLRVDNMAHL